MICPKCGGSGQLPDPLEMRKRRERKGISLQETAKKMKISHGYLSDLERGNRTWNDALRKAFIAAIEW